MIIEGAISVKAALLNGKRDVSLVYISSAKKTKDLNFIRKIAKLNGVPLYKLARKGETVAREPRLIHVYDFRLLSYEAPVGRFEVMCGKGTYVRTLCHDVGKALGCGACMKSLRRIASGKLRIEDAITLDAALAMDRVALVDRIIPCYHYSAG